MTANDLVMNYFEVGGTQKWHAGPVLPIEISYASMVEHPAGGVVLIGGQSRHTILNTIYYLPNAYSEWLEMTQKLVTPRRYHTSILVPKSISSCSLGRFYLYHLSLYLHWGLVIGPRPRPNNEYYKYLNFTKIETYVPFLPDNEYSPITRPQCIKLCMKSFMEKRQLLIGNFKQLQDFLTFKALISNANLFWFRIDNYSR